MNIIDCIKSITPILEFFTLIVLILTLAVIAWSTYETYKMRKGQENIINLEKEKRIPNVIASFEEGNKYSDILFEIENSGGGVAYDIKIQLDPAFNVKDHTFNRYLNNSKALINGISILKSGKSHKIFAASTLTVGTYYEAGTTINNYRITITYNDVVGNNYEQVYEDSIDKFFTRINPDTERKTLTIRALEDINTTLKEINNNISKGDDIE